MSTHQHGSQDLSAHHETYHNIMELVVWGGGFVALSVLLASMIFAAGLHWLLSIAVTVAVGILMGVVLKRGGAWHATVIGLGLFVLVLGWGISALHGMS